MATNPLGDAPRRVGGQQKLTPVEEEEVVHYLLFHRRLGMELLAVAFDVSYGTIRNIKAKHAHLFAGRATRAKKAKETNE